MAFILEGTSERNSPEGCGSDQKSTGSSAGMEGIPGQVALIGPGNKVIQRQIIFPGSNYGWLYFEHLEKGKYGLYVQLNSGHVPKGLS